MNDTDKMTREEIKEFIFDIFVEVIEATGSVPALPPDEIAKLCNESVGRVKGCMMELVQEDILESFKEDDDLFFRLTDDVLDDLIADLEESGWEPPDNLAVDED